MATKALVATIESAKPVYVLSDTTRKCGEEKKWGEATTNEPTERTEEIEIKV